MELSKLIRFWISYTDGWVSVGKTRSDRRVIRCHVNQYTEVGRSKARLQKWKACNLTLVRFLRACVGRTWIPSWRWFWLIVSELNLMKWKSWRLFSAFHFTNLKISSNLWVCIIAWEKLSVLGLRGEQVQSSKPIIDLLSSASAVD